MMPEIAINTTIDYDDYRLDERIVAAAAEQLLQAYALHRSNDLVRDALLKAVDRRAEEAVQQIFDRGIQPVDSFGQPKGEPVPLPDFIVEATKGWLDQKVSKNDGSLSRDSYGGGKITRGEFLVRKWATEGLHDLAVKEVRSVREEAKQNIAEALSKAVVEAVEKRR